MYTKEVRKEQEKNIIDLFKSGVRAKEIPAKVAYKLSYVRVLKVLRKNNIKTEGSGGKNRIINFNPFLANTDSTNYWLGYIASDGCVSSKKYSISICSADREHLAKINNIFENKLNLHESINEAGTLMRTAVFGNKEIHSYLISLGITPRKSKTLFLNFPLNGAFIRGVFDGDGSVSQNRPKITTASITFINQLKSYFDSLDISYTVTVKHKILFPEIYDIWILERSRKTFFDLMYTNAEVFLERKYDKYRLIIQ